LQSYDKAANQKNPAFAFEVAKELVKKDRNWRFLFVGYKGQTGAIMEKEIHESALAEFIRFLDIRKDIPRLMSASDVLIFPSLWEGLGMVAVEAQCNGMNVIMSKGVPQEAIVCKELVTTLDLTCPTDWVNCIVSMKTNQEDRHKYAEVVRNSPFSIENSIKKLISLYEG
jgi:glycosyltransferase EpsF